MSHFSPDRCSAKGTPHSHSPREYIRMAFRSPRRPLRRTRITAAVLLLAVFSAAPAQSPRPLLMHPQPAGGMLVTPDPSGMLETATPSGRIDTSNPFFKSLGSNGRTCNSCHRQAEGWTITPAEVRQRFNATNGL